MNTNLRESYYHQSRHWCFTGSCGTVEKESLWWSLHSSLWSLYGFIFMFLLPWWLTWSCVSFLFYEETLIKLSFMRCNYKCVRVWLDLNCFWNSDTHDTIVRSHLQRAHRMKDSSHSLFTLLPSDNRYRSTCCCTTRLHSSFTRQTERLLNSSSTLWNVFTFLFCVA